MIIRLALRNVFRNRSRFLLTTFVVAAASLLLVYATGQIAGVDKTLVTSMTDTLTGHIQIKPIGAPKDFFDYPSARRLELLEEAEVSDLIGRIRTVDGVVAAAPRIRFGSLIGNDERSVPALVMAVDPVHEAAITPDLQPLLTRLGQGGEGLISTYLAKKLGVGPREEILAFTDTPNDSFNARPFRLAGYAEAPVLIDEFMNPLFLIHADAARQLLYLSGGATEIALRVDPDRLDRVDAIVAEIERALSPAQRDRVAVYSYRDLVKSVGNISGIATGIGSIQVGTVLFVMLVIVLIVTKMSLHERRAEIGTLMSLGMTPQRLIALFITEVTIKIAIGFGLGGLVALLILHGVRVGGGIRAQSMVEQYLYGGKVMFPVVDLERIAIGGIVVLVAALLTTLATCWKAGSEDVVQLLASKK